jgi:hypothetical protein
MQDETKSQSAWLYTSQMLSIVLTIGAAYINYQLNILEAGSSSLLQWAGMMVRKATTVAS